MLHFDNFLPKFKSVIELTCDFFSSIDMSLIWVDKVQYNNTLTWTQT